MHRKSPLGVRCYEGYCLACHAFLPSNPGFNACLNQLFLVDVAMPVFSNCADKNDFAAEQGQA